MHRNHKSHYYINTITVRRKERNIYIYIYIYIYISKPNLVTLFLETDCSLQLVFLKSFYSHNFYFFPRSDTATLESVDRTNIKVMYVEQEHNLDKVER